MKLSICMMVKDEEQNMERCLNSLQPLLKGIDSELIIVDTGSSDGTVEIAKRYTDKVYFKQWFNDFSGMRNYSTSLAKGEWIFIVDADEELVDSNLLIKFLKNKEQSKFNTISIKVLNIVSLSNRRNDVITWSTRLFRNEGRDIYSGIVHNEPKCDSPIIQIETILNHYGYISSDQGLMDRKFERTTALLKQELKKNPKNVYYQYQLSVSYGMHKDHDLALIEAERAYDLLKTNNLNPKDHFYVYPQLIKCYIVSFKYDKGEEICREAIKVYDDFVDLYYYLGKTTGAQNKKEEAVIAYKRYLELIKIKDEIPIMNSGIVNTDTLGYVDSVYADLTRIHSIMKLHKEAIEYAWHIQKSDIAEGTYKHLATSFFELEDIEGLYKYYTEKVLGNNERDSIDKFIFAIEEKSSNLEEKNMKKLYSKFCEENSFYGKLNKLRSIAYTNTAQTSQNLFKEQLDELAMKCKEGKIPVYYGEIVYLYIKTFCEISNVLSDIEETQINKLFEYLGEKYKNIALEIQAYLDKMPINNDIVSIRTRKQLSKYGLIFEKNLNREEYFRLFGEYIKLGIQYVSIMFSKDFVEQEIFFTETTKENTFFILLKSAFEIKNQNLLEYIKLLNKALKVFPYMSKGIGYLLEDVKEESSKTEEVKKVCEEAKRHIKLSLESGDIQTAEAMIDEYKKLSPEDIEIFSFSGIVAMMVGDLEKAITYFIEGIQKDKNNVDLLYNLGYCYLELGDHQNSKNYFEQAKVNTKDEQMKKDIEGILSELPEQETEQKKNKVVFFVKQGMDSFLGGIIDAASNICEVKKVIVTNWKHIEEGMIWADICWFEWCDELVAYGSKLSIAKEKRIICRLHSYEAFTDLPANVNWNNVNELVFVSNHIKNHVINKFNFNKYSVKTNIVPNGMDKSKYRFNNRSNGYKIAYVGYINYKKGPMLLLHAFKALADLDKRFCLYIAGVFQDERYILYFEQMIRELQLEGRVIFEGWQSNLDNWLEDKNYLLSTSVLEGHPVSIMEAMCKGIKPLIHNFYGASGIYPRKYLWNSIDDLIEMVGNNEYDSNEYREFIKNRYSIQPIMNNIVNIILDSNNIQYITKEEEDKDSYCEREKLMVDEDKSVKAYYDKFTDHLKKDRERENPRHKYLTGRLSKIILKDNKVLDLGCGIGITTEFIQSLGVKEVKGVDLSSQNIDFARNTISGIEFINHDITTLSLNDKYDVITLCDVIEHVPRERYSALFNVIKNHLDEGGFAFITIPDPQYLDFIRGNMPDRLQIIDNSITFREFEGCCYDAGLQIKYFNVYGIDIHNQYNEYIICDKGDYKKSWKRLLG